MGTSLTYFTDKRYLIIVAKVCIIWCFLMQGISMVPCLLLWWPWFIHVRPIYHQVLQSIAISAVSIVNAFMNDFFEEPCSGDFSISSKLGVCQKSRMPYQRLHFQPSMVRYIWMCIKCKYVNFTSIAQAHSNSKQTWPAFQNLKLH